MDSPQCKAGQQLPGLVTKGWVAQERAAPHLEPDFFHKTLSSAEHGDEPNQEGDVHVPAAEGRGCSLLANDGAVARGDPEVKGPDPDQDDGRPRALGDDEPLRSTTATRTCDH